jgi:hypothetical protein
MLREVGVPAGGPKSVTRGADLSEAALETARAAATELLELGALGGPLTAAVAARQRLELSATALEPAATPSAASWRLEAAMLLGPGVPALTFGAAAIRPELAGDPPAAPSTAGAASSRLALVP